MQIHCCAVHQPRSGLVVLRIHVRGAVLDQPDQSIQEAGLDKSAEATAWYSLSGLYKPDRRTELDAKFKSPSRSPSAHFLLTSPHLLNTIALPGKMSAAYGLLRGSIRLEPSQHLQARLVEAPSLPVAAWPAECQCRPGHDMGIAKPENRVTVSRRTKTSILATTSVL